MRRKVFAVLMIVALILCFMPSTAFAWYGGNVEIPPADFGGESGGESGEESGGEVTPPDDGKGGNPGGGYTPPYTPPITVVPEPEVPLAPTPEEVEVEDTEVPKTGDNGVGAASMMMLLSAAGAMALLLLGRKKEEK